MPTLTDTKFEYLRGQGYTGAMSDMMLAWLADNSAVQAGTISDQWREFLIARGETPPFSINEAWNHFLSLLTYSGTLTDKEFQFWANSAPLPPLATYHAFSNGFSNGFDIL